MMTLLERAIVATQPRLVLLAPAGKLVSDHFDQVDFNFSAHQHLLRKLQRFRGAVYLHDGAIRRGDLSHGLHETPEDDRAWHLVMLDQFDEVVASAWYLDHDNHVHFDRLRLRHSPLANDSEWRQPLWDAVTHDISRARESGLRFAEVGGWAVADEHRRSCDGLVVALACYALGRICGGTIGITTATVKHGSSSILRRIGGQRLLAPEGTVPPYYDGRHRCIMEILRFDSRRPSTRFEPVVEMLRETLAQVAVVARPYWPNARETQPDVSPAAVPFYDAEPAAAVA